MRITSRSVVSIISGAEELSVSSFTTRCIVAASSARSVSATQTSSTCAPDATCDSASDASASYSSANTNRRALRDPCVLMRSPTKSGRGS